MIAAAPEGTTPRRIGEQNSKQLPARLCLGEALRRESIVWRKFSGCELTGSCLFFQSRIFLSFENYPEWINCLSDKKMREITDGICFNKQVKNLWIFHLFERFIGKLLHACRYPA
jgi:hypothetical protein